MEAGVAFGARTSLRPSSLGIPTLFTISNREGRKSDKPLTVLEDSAALSQRRQALLASLRAYTANQADEREPDRQETRAYLELVDRQSVKEFVSKDHRVL